VLGYAVALQYSTRVLSWPVFICAYQVVCSVRYYIQEYIQKDVAVGMGDVNPFCDLDCVSRP